MITESEANHLKEKQRALRDGFQDSLGLRVHRAISWLQRAAKEQDDQMLPLFFYGSHLTLHIRRILVLHTMSPEKRSVQSFLSTRFYHSIRLIIIYNIVWTRFPHEIQFSSGESLCFWSILEFPEWDRRL